MFLPWSGEPQSFQFLWSHCSGWIQHPTALFILNPAYRPGHSPPLLRIRAPSLLGEPNPLAAPLSFRAWAPLLPRLSLSPVCSSIQHTLPHWYCPYPQLPVFCNMLLTDLYLIYILHPRPDPSIQLPTRYLDLKVQSVHDKSHHENTRSLFLLHCLSAGLSPPTLKDPPFCLSAAPQDTVSPSLILSLLFHPQFGAALHQWLIWVSITTLAT